MPRNELPTWASSPSGSDTNRVSKSAQLIGLFKLSIGIQRSADVS